MDIEVDLTDRVALVTGASRGIGAATARALGAAGASVALLARDEERLERVAAEIEPPTMVLVADVTEPAACRAAVETTVEQLGGLDVLVNNAGVGGVDYERFEDADPAAIARVIDVNLTGAITMTGAALPWIRERQGHVIFVGSSAAMRPRAGAAVYAASKWGLRGFALSLEAHAGADGVAVTSIHTSLVRTDRWADVPAGAAADPEEIARAICYAAGQPGHTTVSELTLHRRDILGTFVPADIDIDPSFEPSEQ